MALPRQLDQKRHLDGRLIDEELVTLFTVLAQHLAVVARDDDQGVFVKPQGLQFGQNRPDAVVGEGDFPGVGVVGELAGEWFGRLVGQVGVV